ncbi:pseudouridine synthase [Shewanella intestini]|uniref:Pseudouridine synthase n=1 Tax=Shewanella intestini TaxID=2017544 RepID=A0ABS5I589_9GAMM|nr:MULTISPECIES: pseudouridine synthase [Shewanella]MBR9729195.1 pseudouridine synthase [Shewanella intestini]MRG37234.1 pseudouridine synthase [Shewanella sp. XMDDZSB0408]
MAHFRLAHYLALCGIASRKQCARLITAGKVMIEGRPANHIDLVDDTCPVELVVNGNRVPAPANKQYWIYHKPVGVNCNLLVDDPHSLVHQLPSEVRLFPVGRLDKDSRGLLLLTNDGQFNQQLMHPKFHYPKTYHVQLERSFNPNFITQMATGVSYKNVTTQACKVSALTSNLQGSTTDRFEICLTQGMNRQIRRMAKALGYRVIDLHRVAIGGEEFADVTENKMRPLSAAELSALQALAKP